MHTLGFVFPGQGSQSVGMLADIAGEFSEVKKIYAEASDVLDYDLWKLVQEGPAEELDKTIHTQPALLAAGYAIWCLCKKSQPILLAGHSLGEYTALVCAEAILFSDAVRLVAARGEYMQDAAPAGLGALAAVVGLEDQVVAEICEQAVLPGEVLSPANFNSPGQVVIGGHTAAVERALLLAKTAGARLTKILPVSVPSHSMLMKPAAERLAQELEKIVINIPVIPVLNNIDVKIYDSAESIRSGLTRQLYNPVRWVETIQAFGQHGISHIVECGPGKVLSGLNKRILPDIQLTSTMDLANLKEFINP